MSEQKKNISIPISNFDLTKLNVKPITEKDIKTQQEKSQILTTFITYNKDKFYLKCNHNINLISYAGLPTYNPKIHGAKKNGENMYNLSINFYDDNDTENNDENLKQFKNVLKQIDKYVLSKKNDILKDLLNLENNGKSEDEEPVNYKYMPLIKKKPSGLKKKDYPTFDKVSIKLPYDKKTNQFSDNFKIYKLCDDNLNHPLVGIKNLDDLQQVIRKGAVLKFIIYFQKIWISQALHQWGITLRCEQLSIINEGKSKTTLGYELDDNISEQPVQINNTFNIDAITEKKNSKKSNKKSNDDITNSIDSDEAIELNDDINEDDDNDDDDDNDKKNDDNDDNKNDDNDENNDDNNKDKNNDDNKDENNDDGNEDDNNIDDNEIDEEQQPKVIKKPPKPNTSSKKNNKQSNKPKQNKKKVEQIDEDAADSDGSGEI